METVTEGPESPKLREMVFSGAGMSLAGHHKDFAFILSERKALNSSKQKSDTIRFS